MNIFILNFIPVSCPHCGENLLHGKLAREDFYAYASFSCDCGTKYQFVPEAELLKAAQSVGDMKGGE